MDRLTEPSQPSNDITLTEKTLFGINAVRKKITAKTDQEIERLTGIPIQEMFGTETGAEKILYVGAPWQTRGIPDEKRITVVDYEFGEIATFTRTYDDLVPQIGEPLYDYGPGKRSMTENLRELEEFPDSIGSKEMEWCDDVFYKSRDFFNNLLRLSGRNPDQENLETNQLAKLEIDEETKKNLQIETRQQLEKLKNLYTSYQQNFSKQIAARKAIEQDGNNSGIGFSGKHPVTELTDSLQSLMKRAEQGIKDIQDYELIVKQRLDAFTEKLPNDVKGKPQLLRKLLKTEELSILNELRLKKTAKDAGVVAAMFPDLPFKNQSFDRMIFSYSISTHIISEMNVDEFRLWWKEILRSLKPEGKAYIFPIQLGFPYGRMYDVKALKETLDELKPELSYEIKANTHSGRYEDSDFHEETLVITKNSLTENVTPQN